MGFGEDYEADGISCGGGRKKFVMPHASELNCVDPLNRKERWEGQIHNVLILESRADDFNSQRGFERSRKGGGHPCQANASISSSDTTNPVYVLVYNRPTLQNLLQNAVFAL